MNSAILKLIDDARKHDCDVIIDNQGLNPPFSIEIITPNHLYDDASGKFEILITNPNDDKRTKFIGYYLIQSHSMFGYSTDLDMNDSYQNMIDKIHIACGTCDGCHKYFGTDNLHRVEFNRKACDDCVTSLRAKYEIPGCTR